MKEFLTAIQSHKGIILKAATIYTDTPEDRQDLMQEILLQLWKSFKSFEGKSELSTWMYRVAMNTALYQLRYKKRYEFIEPTADYPPVLADFGESSYQEQERWLQTHIRTLNVIERSILMLHLEEKSYREIAEIIGISESNVGTRLSRIKKKLKLMAKKNA